MSEWRENIERVREALTPWLRLDGRVDALAALTALIAQMEKLEEQARFWKYEQTEASKELVARAETAEQRVEKLGAALQVLYDWSSRMPDAGFTAASPRYLWWFERPVAQVRAALALSDPPEDSE